MPIEIRRSDVVAQAAETFSKTTQALTGISRDLYEAERVSQVNTGLAFIERAFQTYGEQLPTRQFDVKVEDTDSIVQKPFGEIDQATLIEDYAKYVNEQMEYLTRTVTNKDARQELIQHLQMGAISKRGQVMSAWNQAVDHVAKAGLQELIDTVMASDVPWETKVERISKRVDEMVRTGRLWKDEGEQITQRAIQAAQYAYSRDGSMQAMKNGYITKGADGKEQYIAPGLEAGERWLNENTPFYASDPDARSEILDEVRREYDYESRMIDEQLDRNFSDMYLGANTIAKVDQALSALARVQFYNGEKKYYWTTRLQGLRQYLQNLEETPEDGQKALENQQKAYEADLWGWVVSYKAEHPDAVEFIWDRIEEAYDNHLIRSDSKKSFRAYLDEGEDVPMVEGLKYLRSKGAGLDDKMQMYAIKELRTWRLNNPDAPYEKVLKAAENIAQPIVREQLADLVDKSINYNLKGKRKLTDLEAVMQAIEEGGMTALTEVAAPELDRLGGALKELARREHPGEGIWTYWIDPRGIERGPGNEIVAPGTIFLLNTDSKRYMFKIEDQEAVLYKFTKDGWVRLPTQEERKAEVKEAKKEEKEEQKEERQAEQARRLDLLKNVQIETEGPIIKAPY